MKKRNKVLLAFGTLGVLSMMLTSTAHASSGGMMSAMHKVSHEAVHNALISNDYTAFKNAISSLPQAKNMPTVTPEIFAKLVEAEKLKDAGDIAGAKKIMQTLGFPGHKGKMMMNHFNKMQKLTDAQKETLKQANELFKAGKDAEAKQLLENAGIEKPMHNRTKRNK